MSLPPILPSEVDEVYRNLNLIGALGTEPSVGFLRAAYSDEESAAMAFIASLAGMVGGVSVYDAIGNLSLSWPGKSTKYIEFGSHLDTVPRGGNFDGAAGIVAGLLAISSVVREMPNRRLGLRLRVWRGEESATFNTLYIGSLGAFGKFDAATLTNCFQGRSLEEAIRGQGYDPNILKRGELTIPPEEISGIIAHIELHIEQGSVLELSRVALGVVTSIRGSRRARIFLRGEFDHSGATPMGTMYRRDVNLAMAHILVRLDSRVNEELRRGNDIVQTIGVINSNRGLNDSLPEVYQNALSKVSGFGYFDLDVRGCSNALIDRYFEDAETLVTETAASFGVSSEFRVLGRARAVEQLDAKVQDVLDASSRAGGFSSMRIASGAGHDAGVVANHKRVDGSHIPTGMLFIPCRAGKSHSPDEFATADSIAAGATVLAEAYRRFEENDL